MNYCLNRSTITRAEADVVIKKICLVRKNCNILPIEQVIWSQKKYTFIYRYPYFYVYIGPQRKQQNSKISF